MGHTYTNLMYHGIFSTKERRPLLGAIPMAELTKVVGGIIRDRDGKLLAFNGTENHVHLLAFFHPSRSVSDMFRDIKAVSCDWVHATFRGVLFSWQSGYGAFTVSKSNSPAVERYIVGQVEHHRKQTFEEEFKRILELHGIEYDIRYVFDSEVTG
ncbi:MAG: IS200/IS605 family transposase [Phycisphaerae bacterium]